MIWEHASVFVRRRIAFYLRFLIYYAHSPAIVFVRRKLQHYLQGGGGTKIKDYRSYFFFLQVGDPPPTPTFLIWYVVPTCFYFFL